MNISLRCDRLDVSADCRTASTAAATPPLQGAPWPGSTQVAFVGREYVEGFEGARRLIREWCRLRAGDTSGHVAGGEPVPHEDSVDERHVDGDAARGVAGHPDDAAPIPQQRSLFPSDGRRDPHLR